MSFYPVNSILPNLHLRGCFAAKVRGTKWRMQVTGGTQQTPQHKFLTTQRPRATATQRHINKQVYLPQNADTE